MAMDYVEQGQDQQERHVAALPHEMQRCIDNAIACGETQARPQLGMAAT